MDKAIIYFKILLVLNIIIFLGTAYVFIYYIDKL